MDKLGDRMKNNYENRSRYFLTKRTPVIVRIDGKAFHTYTKDYAPFSPVITQSMLCAARVLLNEIQGCKLAYTQSDEISLLITDFDTLQTEAYFDYNKSKIESVTASIATAYFNQCINSKKIALFDSRAFNIPKEEVSNYFLWRAKDCKRNSVQMFARTKYSHVDLHKMSTKAVLEKLEKSGYCWDSLPKGSKNGFFLTQETILSSVKDNYEEISNLIEPLLKVKEE